MNRADLIERVSKKGQMNRGRAELLVDTVFDCLERSLRQGEKIEVRGFGTFQIRWAVSSTLADQRIAPRSIRLNAGAMYASCQRRSTAPTCQ